MEYKYGMRLRGFSIGCQPMRGLLRREDDMSGKYYDILVYDRELTADELISYELDDIRDTDNEESEQYYALVYSDGTKVFASIDNTDDAAAMLAEDGNEDAYIGFFYKGKCTMKLTRDDVFTIDLVVMDVRNGYAISTIVESIEDADELWEYDKSQKISEKKKHQRKAYFLGKFYTYNDDVVGDAIETIKTYM